MRIPVILLSLLILSPMAQAIVPAQTLGADEFFMQSQRNVREQVDTLIRRMESDVERAPSNRERFRVMNQTLVKVRALRDNSLPQGARDEAHMDLMVAVLESLPKQSAFQKKNCLRYENDLINQFEPAAEEAPQEPAVVPGWRVLESLCR